MANVQDWFIEPAELHQEVEIKASDKLPAIKVKELTGEDLNRIQRSATNKTRSKSGQIVENSDSSKFMDGLITESVVEPNLSDNKLQEHYGTIGDPAGTLRSMLSAGEYGNFMSKLQEINGFDEAEEVEKAKK
ncbi:phage tail assembly chaperone [Fructobacillus tropaeoli]|uniref:Phage XkdN-like protein n=1 Tax=Fructobacillus tropaeoli TaxID=709323 RepID=A0A3F3H5J9_9LACO|nr:hypothetical protein [Fructobacillus tropaeoli]GAP04882.1 hypothetical protein FTRO_0110170 [Fructobacillus tropaeoli]